MTRGGRVCRFSSLRSRRLAARLSRRLWTKTSSTTPSWSTARQSQCFWPAIIQAHLASRAGESHPHALPEPYVTLSRHTAPDVRPFPCGMENGLALATELLPLPVGSGSRQNTAAPLVQFHYRTFLPPTSCSAPVPRIGTLILAV